MPPPSRPSDAEIVGGLLLHGVDVAYQPIHDLGTTGVVGWEALMRGRLPDHGRLSPLDMVGSASRAGALDGVMQQVAEQALTTAAVASILGGRRFTMTVNVEPDQIRSDSVFLPWLVERAAGSPVDLVLEITERGDAAAWGREQDAALDRLRSGGLGLAIDDLGAGPSRLRLLTGHDWAWVKLDRSLIASGPRAEVVLRHTVAMLHELGAAVVVEGIETQEQLDLARAVGADLAQGHLLGAPVPVRELLDGLSESTS